MTETNPFDAQLIENKRRYDVGEIGKDLYEKNGRAIRKKRRDWNRRNDPDHPTVQATVTSATDPVGTLGGKTPKKRKPRAQKDSKDSLNLSEEKLNEYTESMRNYFESQNIIEVDFVTYQGSFHACLFPDLIKAHLEDPTKAVGQVIVEKFRKRWLMEPKCWVSYLQGGVPVLGIGPLLKDDQNYAGISRASNVWKLDPEELNPEELVNETV